MHQPPDRCEALTSPEPIRRGGLLLFDGKTGNFKTANAVIIDFIPISRSWLLVDGQFAIFVER